MNDDRSNLQVLTKGEHFAKTNGGGPAMVTFICPTCGSEASKNKRTVDGNRRKGKAGPYCSRRCAGKAHH